jgi:hypothetical protein
LETKTGEVFVIFPGIDVEIGKNGKNTFSGIVQESSDICEYKNPEKISSHIKCNTPRESTTAEGFTAPPDTEIFTGSVQSPVISWALTT